MKGFTIFLGAFRGCLVSAFTVLFVMGAMVLAVNYQYPADPACQGRLGAGFPVLFICDHAGGGSPTNSWGKITFDDVLNGGIQIQGFLIDLLFYAVLFYLVILFIYGIVASTRKPVAS